MAAADVHPVLDLAAALEVRIWLDGGWAVDACLGRETRRHADLDIVIEERHLATMVAALTARGYGPVARPDTQPWNFVLGDGAGHEVDVHVVTLDEAGTGSYGPPERGVSYPAPALTGRGSIDGRPVDCISPDWLVRFHTGYPVDADDWADVSALCDRFGLPVPDDYARFRDAK